jgi:hypothetical protein
MYYHVYYVYMYYVFYVYMCIMCIMCIMYYVLCIVYCVICIKPTPSILTYLLNPYFYPSGKIRYRLLHWSQQATRGWACVNVSRRETRRGQRGRASSTHEPRIQTEIPGRCMLYQNPSQIVSFIPYYIFTYNICVFYTIYYDIYDNDIYHLVSMTSTTYTSQPLSLPKLALMNSPFFKALAGPKK